MPTVLILDDLDRRLMRQLAIRDDRGGDPGVTI